MKKVTGLSSIHFQTHLGILCFGLLLTTLGQAGEGAPDGPYEFEQAAELTLQNFLSPIQIKDTYHEVKALAVDNAFAKTTIETVFGPYEASSLALLNIRLDEIKTLAWAVDLEGGDEFVDSLKESVVQIPESAAETVQHPIASIKKVGKGVKETITRVAQDLRWSKKSRYEDGLIKSVLFAKYKRHLAHDLKLDPYSSNPDVQRLLDRLARARFSGKIPMRLVGMVLPTYASIAITVLRIRAQTDLNIRDHTAGELRARNNHRLEDMEVGKDARLAFLGNKNLSPRHQTAIVNSMEILQNVHNIGLFLVSSTAAGNETEALFSERQAEMLAYYHKEVSPLCEIESAGTMPFAVTEDDGAVLFAPYDYLLWTPEFKEVIEKVSRDPLFEKAKNRKLFVTGHVSPLARLEMEKRHIEVKAGAVEKHPCPPPGIQIKNAGDLLGCVGPSGRR